MTALPEVRLIHLQNHSALLTSLKEKKVVTVWDPVPKRSPYGTPFFHEDKKGNGTLVKRSIKEEVPEGKSNDLRAFEKWFAEQSSREKTSLEKEVNDKGSLNANVPEDNSQTKDRTPSDESSLKKRSLHETLPEEGSSNLKFHEEKNDEKMTEGKSLHVERAMTKRRIQKRSAKRSVEPLFDPCQVYPGNVYVLASDDDNLVYKVKTLHCDSDGCFIASKRFKIGECIATKKTIVVHVSDGCNGLKPLTIEVGCNCKCLKNLQFL